MRHPQGRRVMETEPNGQKNHLCREHILAIWIESLEPGSVFRSPTSGTNPWSGIMLTKKRRCPILVEANGQLVKSHLFASSVEQPADISMKIRDQGWKPFRVRFDDSH